jgi:2-polyprenyl-3-methyl-5-hydroxy-6-metoxy-1,4-benzoquinol methylase
MSIVRSLTKKFSSLVSDQIPDTTKITWQNIKYKTANRSFLSPYLSFPLPPDELLFETGQINYHWYLKSGREAATECFAFFQAFHPSPAKTVLDWGCGVGRVTRHLPDFFPEAKIIGIDINQKVVEWLQQHIPNTQFLFASDIHSPFSTPFDLVIGTSVLTHLPADRQASTLLQLKDWLAPHGIACISTRGKYYYPELSTRQLYQLNSTGLLTCGASIPGSRGMRTYHTPPGLQQVLPPDLEVLLYYDGKQFPGILGGQDLWILQKKTQQVSPTAL